MYKISKNTESNIPMNILGHMPELAKKTNHIGDIWTNNCQINELPNQATISVHIFKEGRSRISKFKLTIYGG